MGVQEWIDAYAAAWRTKDPDAAAALFTEHGRYQDDPFGKAHVGHTAIRAYWADACSTQDAVLTRFGHPIVETGDGRAAVEFWVTNLDRGKESTLTGILYLHFSVDGLCEELRETWIFAAGHLEPSANWGT